MTVKVYVWRAEGSQVGHASMELGDGTYVSLWPGKGKAGKKKKKGKRQHTCTSEDLEEDIAEEKRSPTHTFYIHRLDENNIKGWWHGFNKNSWSWTQNCCKTVIDGLRVGGSDRKLNPIDRVYYNATIIWTPRRVAKYCQALRTFRFDRDRPFKQSILVGV